MMANNDAHTPANPRSRPNPLAGMLDLTIGGLGLIILVVSIIEHAQGKALDAKAGAWLAMSLGMVVLGSLKFADIRGAKGLKIPLLISSFWVVTAGVVALALRW